MAAAFAARGSLARADSGPRGRLTRLGARLVRAAELMVAAGITGAALGFAF
jgi:hypothetical protein